MVGKLLEAEEKPSANDQMANRTSAFSIEGRVHNLQGCVTDSLRLNIILLYSSDVRNSKELEKE